MNLLRPLCAAFLWVASLTASAGVMLTADVYDTPGLPGYQTFDLTASSSVGFLNGFDFTDSGLGGINGPLHQGAAPGGDPMTSYTADMLFGGLSGDAADSHWLVNSTDGFAVQSSQSDLSLETAYVFGSASGLRDTYRSLPFARIVTNDPSAVSLNGEFLVEQRWSDGAGAGTKLFDVGALLSEISTGPAPVYTTFPDRPAPPAVEEPPIVEPSDPITPPGNEPPRVETPVAIPPVVPEPPAVEPTEEIPPAAEPVVLPTEVVVWPSEPVTLPEYLGKGNVWQHPYWNEQCLVYTEPFAIGVGAWQVIDVTSEIDLEVIELSDFVTTRGVVSGEPVFINVAYDGDASSLAFATDAVVELGATPEPTTAVLLLLAVCGSVRYRRG